MDYLIPNVLNIFIVDYIKNDILPIPDLMEWNIINSYHLQVPEK